MEFEVCLPCVDLVSAPKELCLFCHRVHTQNFPELDISQYMQSYSPADMADSNLDCGQHQRCSFCHELMNTRIPAQTQPLTSADGSGLDSLRVACAVRLPQNDLEFSLAGGWTVGGAEAQKKIFQSAITPEHCEGETDAGEPIQVIKVGVSHNIIVLQLPLNSIKLKGRPRPPLRHHQRLDELDSDSSVC